VTDLRDLRFDSDEAEWGQAAALRLIRAGLSKDLDATGAEALAVLIEALQGAKLKPTNGHPTLEPPLRRLFFLVVMLSTAAAWATEDAALPDESLRVEDHLTDEDLGIYLRAMDKGLTKWRLRRRFR
jgi:hypothetical protein